MTDASVFALSMLAIVIIFAGPCGDDPRRLRQTRLLPQLS